MPRKQKRKTNSKKNGSKKQRETKSLVIKEKPPLLWTPSTKQIDLVTYLVDPEDRRTKEEKCKAAGVAKKTYYNWLRNPDFQAFLKDAVSKYAMSSLPDVFASLIRKAKNGNVNAIRTYLEVYQIIKAADSKPSGVSIETNGPVQVVFGMAEPPGKREEPIEAEVIESEVVEDE